MEPAAPFQVSALPLRRTRRGIEVLLVTTRNAQRWILPKGRPREAIGNAKSAARKARNEAGVIGRIGEWPVGRYVYWQCQKASVELVTVEVYPLDVTRQLDRWRDQGRRKQRWLTPDEAARMVVEPELKKILRSLVTVVQAA